MRKRKPVSVPFAPFVGLQYVNGYDRHKQPIIMPIVEIVFCRGDATATHVHVNRNDCWPLAALSQALI